jgi:hypothetical protein
MVLDLIRSDQGDQYIQLVAFRGIGLGPPQRLDLGQGGIIVLLGFDGSNLHCFVFLLALQLKFVVLGMGADKFHEHGLPRVIHINYQPVLVSRNGTIPKTASNWSQGGSVASGGNRSLEVGF